jgi:hypothetical protein
VSAVTGVELGPNYCVLVRATRHGSRTTVSALRTIAAEEWPDDPDARADVLRQIKRDERFPSRARVVQWRDQGSFVRSLRDAGFEIESTQTPAQALAQLVRDRSLESDHKPVAAIALNTRGAIIAVVSNGAVISSRTFEWPLGRPFSGAHPEQLERYLVVSQLAPQLQHIIQLVRPVYGVQVSSVVLCGNLPNLRSLSMLLIEELDIEVETLDSTDLLDLASGDVGQLAESTPALQLAVAASTSTSRPASISPSPSTSAVARPAIGVVALALATAWVFTQLSGSARAVPLLPGGASPAVAVVPADPALRAEATMGRIGHPPPSPAPAPAAPPAVADAPAPARSTARDVEEPRPAPTAAPLPRVDGVMIAGERRLAIVDGLVVAPGDRIGGRSIARIERDGVMLREPSGREVFVAVRPRRREIGGS